MDADKDSFLKNDIIISNNDEYKLDNYIKNSNCEFIAKYVSVLEKI